MTSIFVKLFPLLVFGEIYIQGIIATSFETVVDKFAARTKTYKDAKFINWDVELKPLFSLVTEKSINTVQNALAEYLNCNLENTFNAELDSLNDKNAVSAIKEQLEGIYAISRRIHLLGDEICLHIPHETTGKSDITSSAEQYYNNIWMRQKVVSSAGSILFGMRDLKKLCSSKRNKFAAEIFSLISLIEEFKTGKFSLFSSILNISRTLNRDNLVGLITELGLAIEIYEETLKKVEKHVSTANASITEFYTMRNLILDVLLGSKSINVIKDIVASLPRNADASFKTVL